MDILADIRDCVINGNVRAVGQSIEYALSEGISADRILEQALIPGILLIGQHYSEYNENIPELLCSAKCMTAGLERLQPYLSTSVAWKKNKILVGTVEGDLHDIGKNLVAIMLQCAGFDVIDLGVDVSAGEFLRALRENPDARIVCLSCLLTTSMARMSDTVRRLREIHGKDELLIMVGGAPITQAFADRIGADCYTSDAPAAAERAKQYLFCSEEGSLL